MSNAENRVLDGGACRTCSAPATAQVTEPVESYYVAQLHGFVSSKVWFYCAAHAPAGAEAFAGIYGDQA